MFYSCFWSQTEKQNKFIKHVSGIVVDWNQQSYKRFGLIWAAGSTAGKTNSIYHQAWISQSCEYGGGFPNATKNGQMLLNICTQKINLGVTTLAKS